MATGDDDDDDDGDDDDGDDDDDDDGQIVSIGPRHLENFVDAFDRTHAHLEAMGAKIAAQKSLTFLPTALQETGWRNMGGGGWRKRRYR